MFEEGAKGHGNPAERATAGTPPPPRAAVRGSLASSVLVTFTVAQSRARADSRLTLRGRSSRLKTEQTPYLFVTSLCNVTSHGVFI
jgi:hypothetical protein